MFLNGPGNAQQMNGGLGSVQRTWSALHRLILQHVPGELTELRVRVEGKRDREVTGPGVRRSSSGLCLATALSVALGLALPLSLGVPTCYGNSLDWIRNQQQEPQGPGR